MEAHGVWVGITAIALLIGAVYIVMQPSFRSSVGSAIARIPAVGAQLRTYQLARMYRTVGMLLRGGMPAVTALIMSEGLLSVRLRASLGEATRAVREGRSIATAMEHYGLTTPVAARMLRVGERSGNMGEMMERIASFYDEQLSRSVDLLTRLIEPALMAIIGSVIGLIVVLMYFPIFELAGSLQ
jgi:general secretion pathway protein F